LDTAFGRLSERDGGLVNVVNTVNGLLAHGVEHLASLSFAPIGRADPDAGHAQDEILELSSAVDLNDTVGRCSDGIANLAAVKAFANQEAAKGTGVRQREIAVMLAANLNASPTHGLFGHDNDAGLPV